MWLLKFELTFNIKLKLNEMKTSVTQSHYPLFRCLIPKLQFQW